MATTPMGTAVFSTISPFESSTRLSTRPTGSGSLTTSLIPSAMPFIRLSSRLSLSIITSVILPLAASTSFLFSSRIAAQFSRSASAMASKALFLSSEPSFASSLFAAFACFKISSVVIISSPFYKPCAHGFSVNDIVKNIISQFFSVQI